MHQKSLNQLKQALDKRQISSVELTQHYLQRIAQHDQQLNAFITVAKDSALEAARQADQIREQQTDIPPLTGIPLAHKDLFCTKGITTTCGSKMLANFVPPYESTVSYNLQQAGMINLGKLNMDEFAMGSSNENSYFGPCKNPWNTNHVPGGSSGGSSSAVAARLTPASTGTDTGGSVRQPAALTGITGLKPTYGRVSRYGMVAFASSFDQAGPMAPSAEDNALLLNAMAGYDPKDSTCVNRAVPDYTAQLNDSLQGLTIGLPDHFFDQHLDNQVAERIEKAIEQLKQLGANFKSVELPYAEAAIPAYYILAPAECSANLARFDGVRYGYRCENPKDLADLYCRSRGEGLGHEVKRRIMMGTYVLSAGYYDAYYAQAQKIRRLIKQDFENVFQSVDVILGPTTPTTAFPCGEKTHDPVSMYLADVYTIAINLAGNPGLSLPVGFANQLPVGMQLVGKHFDEGRLLNIAHQYQQHTDWHQQIPEQRL